MAQIFARKSIATLEAEANAATAPGGGAKFKRSLSMLNLIALGIGNIIGAGERLGSHRSCGCRERRARYRPVVCARRRRLRFLRVVLRGTRFGCFRLLAAFTLMPMRHSANSIAWIIGWDLLLEYALGATAVAIGWSGYVVSFLKDFGIVIPDAFSKSPFSYDAAAHAWHITGAITQCAGDGDRRIDRDAAW